MGRWIAAEGSVFPEFTERNNVLPAFAVPADWPMWMCIDPGYDHPCGVTWNTISPNGRTYTVDEIKLRETSIERIVELIRRRQRGCDAIYLDPHGANQRTQVAAGVTFAQQMATHGFRCQFWPVVQGRELEASVEFHRQRIAAGMYKVFDTCVETIAEHQSWMYKRVRGGEVPIGDDAYEDRNQDCLDGILGWERTGPRFPPPAPAVPRWLPPRQAASTIPKQEHV